MIQNLVSQPHNKIFHPFTQIDYKMNTFSEESAVLSKSETNEERKLRDLKADIEIIDVRNRITPKTSMHFRH